MKVERALEIKSILGEGPVWDPEEGILYWLDVFLPSINRFDPKTGSNRVTRLAQPIYAMALRTAAGAVASLEEGFAFVDLETGVVEAIGDPKAGAPVNFNDGKCDRRGRFWSGTMAKDWQTPIGGLFKLEPARSFGKMDSDIILANGMGWSPDDRTMYFTDFGRSTIYAYDYEIDTGQVSNRREFIRVPPENGFPDGMTVDAEGCLWVAHWDGWNVTRYDTKGAVVDRIAMPVQRPTSCMFGGPDLSTLYVTSATMKLSDAELAQGPMAGSLFAIETKTRGLPEPKFFG